MALLASCRIRRWLMIGLLSWVSCLAGFAANISLPAPLYLENFDNTPEGSLPAGWSSSNRTEVLNQKLDLTNLDSASYANWTTVEANRFRGALMQYSDPAQTGPVYQRVLTPNPALIVNGRALTNLATGRLLFANSGYRRGRSQIEYVFSPDYDLTGRSNVFLSFHSLYEQNQDSLAAIEYSTNQGASWLPISYWLDAADVLSTAGQVDAWRTLTTVYPDVATYLDGATGQTKGGYYGAFLGVASNAWPTLGPYLSARVDDNPVESKRVELYRLPQADLQPKVRFRFAYVGTDSWYFGIDDFGIYSINAGALPVIATTSRRPLRLSAGAPAQFSVSASGQGPFQYQWSRGDVPVAGGTGPVLAIPAVRAGDEGVYSVAVSNGAGTTYAEIGTLSVFAPRVTGQWDFEAANLQATLGADLEFLNDSAVVTQFARLPIGNDASGAMAFAVERSSQGYRLHHGARANGGGRFVNQYTVVMDIRYPASSHNQLRPLWQTDPFNAPGNPAEWWIGDAQSQPEANGLGAEGVFHGPLSPDAWHRLAFAVDLNAPMAQRLSTYLDGRRIATQALADGVDGRHALGPTALLFTTGEPPVASPAPGWVSSVQFVDGWLPESALTAYGQPGASLPHGGLAVRLLEPETVGSDFRFAIDGAEGPFLIQRSLHGLEDWEEVLPAFTNRVVTLPLTQVAQAFRVRTVPSPIRAGPQSDGDYVLSTLQWVRPVPDTVRYAGRPIDMAFAPGSKALYVKDHTGVAVVDTTTWNLRQQLPFGDSGGSMHGIAVNPAGTLVYATTAGNQLAEAAVAADGALAWNRRIVLPDAPVGGSPFPTGIALSPDGSLAYVCLSRNNTLAVVDLTNAKVLAQIATGLAPFDVVLSPDGSRAYVSDWGGRRPAASDRKAKSSGTDVVVDARGVAASGTVSFIDLAARKVTATISVGLHPAGLALRRDGSLLYCANANSDTISVITTTTPGVRETISVRPDPTLPFGSAANALALSADEQRLYVANAGNNAVAVVRLATEANAPSTLEGFIPTDWYPTAVVVDGEQLYVANTKGLGSRGQPATDPAQSVYSFLGTVTRQSLPAGETLSKLTALVLADARVEQFLKHRAAPRNDQPARPVPRRLGEPSVFHHVIYVIKENRTYDQVLGDLAQGNGNTNLCIFGRAVTPNHHALATEFVLLDNFYCNGVNSSDGHAWATEGHVGDYLEKTFGGATRGYTWGDDPLSYCSSGFIWDNVLLHGRSFRNYGEMDYAETVPAGLPWLTIYRDFTQGTNAIRFSQNIGIEPLRPYSVTGFPGWNMRIPDVIRAHRFIQDLQAAELTGQWPDFTILYLPNDHTSGTSPGSPTPRAQVADNDLALGQVIDALSHSRFWADSVVFVVEDDPQNGFDHVDGHRSVGLVVSPYTRRGAVVSEFYNQTAVLHTMERILGIPPMNQMDGMSPLMSACFTPTPDFTPYQVKPNQVPLDEMNPGTQALRGRARYWARRSQEQNFAQVDRADEGVLNRILWHSVKGVSTPYPVAYAGAHGKGLRRLKLRLSHEADDDD